MSAITALEDRYDVAVVGAGPAGLGGCDRDGKRRPVHGGARRESGAGRADLPRDHDDARAGPPRARATTTGRARSSSGRSQASGAQACAGATVWSLSREREIGVSVGGGARACCEARRVVIAHRRAGAAVSDSGLDAARRDEHGGAQTLLKASGLVPERPRRARRCRAAAVAVRAADAARGRADSRDPRYDGWRRIGARAAQACGAVRDLAVSRKGLKLMASVRAARARADRHHVAGGGRARTRSRR